jgi:hypothetical protein
MVDARTPGWERELLERAASDAKYPLTPSLAGPVLARIDARSAAPGPNRRTVLTAVVAAAAVMLGIAGSLLVSGNLREAVAGFLGLAVENEVIQILPTPPPGTTPTPFPAPLALEQFATPVTPGEAARVLPLPPALPEPIGDVVGYYLAQYLERTVVIVEYQQFDLWIAESIVFEKGFVFSKGVTVIEQLTVRGQPAYWLDGGGHIVRVLDSQGQEVVGSVRTVEGKTLVWRSANRNYRLETLTLTKSEAVAIAESLP